LKIAIVIIAYNRVDSLRNLLNSINNAFYLEVQVPLIISIDKSDKSEEFEDSDFEAKIIAMLKFFEDHVFSVFVGCRYIELYTFDEEPENVEGSHCYTIWYNDIGYDDIEDVEYCNEAAMKICEALGDDYDIDENKLNKVVRYFSEE